MDETTELELGQLEAAPPVGDQTTERALSEACASMVRLGVEVEKVATLALETVLNLTDFERGVVLVADSELQDDPSGLLTTLAALHWRGVPESRRLSQLANPEFAVSRSVVARALGAGRWITVKDSMLEPGAAGEVNQRAVFCYPFDLTAQEKGVLYLDRAWGRGELEQQELELVTTLATRCLHIVGRSYAFRELNSLRCQVDTTEASETEAEEVAVGKAMVERYHGLVSRDEKLRKVFQVVEKVKDNDLNICIVGESGTGKELVARAVHEAGARSEKMFVGENCGAISETLLESELFGHVKGAFTGADNDRKGLFELADGGTLFLDEIGDMSESMQRKLLRVLEEGEIRPIGSKETIKVDVRVVAASNRDLKVLVQKGEFRTDLYYRMNVITLELPPLRERPGDIPLLLEEFTAEICKDEGISKRFSESALKALQQYTWPGNVRELRNVVRRVLITSPRRIVARKEVAEYLESNGPVAHSGKCIERDGTQIVLRIPARESFNEIIDECERVVLEHALEASAWNKSKVTKVLKIPRQSLYNKIAKYDLQRSWDEPVSHEA